MSKINKLGKSTFVIAILSFVLVAVLAFGGTYAYFSATVAQKTDSITMGTLNLSLTADSADVTAESTNKIFVTGFAVPNQKIILDKELAVDLGTTNINAYVRVQAKVEVLDSEGNDTLFTDEITTQDGLTEADVVGFNTTVAGWTYHEGFFYLTSDGKAAKVSEMPDDSEIVLSATISSQVGKNGSTALMGAIIKITFSAGAVQADYLDSTTEPGAAMSVADLHDAWGTIVDSTYPVD